MGTTTVLQQIIPELIKQFPMIEVLYLFGSQASNTAKPTSDIDVALFIDRRLYPPDPLLDLKIGAFLEAKLQTRVDILILNTASPVIQHEVLKTGTRLYEKNSEKRAGFELTACKSYIDAKYYQDLRARKHKLHGQ
ncbi:MAG: nucleotidyltransferase domain-containing protein [Desulfohalobiaceae bacterium]|nr:nucleotidyltransferase domain-containing protein [Desulfohalobiaceae bacterium]